MARKRCWRSNEIVFNVIGWILQVLTWIFLILFLVFHKLYLMGIFFAAYLLYILFEFLSPTAKFLFTKNSSLDLYQKMRGYFQMPPKIKWIINCSGFKHKEHTNHNSHYFTSEERELCMSYFSSRDISGHFQLDCDPKKIQKKAFIKLELEADINFADQATFNDYLYQKLKFYKGFADNYERCQILEEKTIPWMKKYNLVKIGNFEPKSINAFLFSIFAILTFAEFYKIYMDSFCIYQKFQIRKVISTRYDLNLDKYIQMYQAYSPSLDLIYAKFTYQLFDYYYRKKKYKLNLPPIEIVENRVEYIKKLPSEQQFPIETNRNQFLNQMPYPTQFPNNMPYPSQFLNTMYYQSQIPNQMPDININQIPNQSQILMQVPNQSQIPNQIPNNSQYQTQNRLNNNKDIQIFDNNQKDKNLYNNPPVFLSDDKIKSSERYGVTEERTLNNENNETRVNIENNNNNDNDNFSPIAITKKDKK